MKKRDWIGLLFPRRCPVCHEAVEERGQLCCQVCRLKLPYVRGVFCQKCGKPLLSGAEEYCRDCAKKPHRYRRGRAPFLYDPVMRSSIARFKYGGRREYAAFYAEEILRSCGREIRLWNAQALVPIPLHPSRRRKRGYNQAELLARELSRRTGIPVDERLLLRTKKTKAQKELNDQERLENLKHAFSVRKGRTSPERIIIVDDIYTTGSTIDEAAGTLAANGARSVYFLCICVGRDQ
ncbi:MAG: ComF family protein [Eubacteriales bacterium]|nr:ComF family protein [Eubacteriales bacterium]